jgi:hypothetical protein
MASLTFYQNAVVGVQALADPADFTLTSDDKLYYHFDCADGDSALWDTIFDAVKYKTIEDAHVGETAESDGQGGNLLRYKHDSGLPDFKKDDLKTQVQLLVNFFMMNSQTVNASGDLDGTNKITVTVIDEQDEDDQFLIEGETWANMLLDTTGRITANQINLIVDHLGSRGRLALSSDGSKKLIQAHLQKPPNANTASDPATEIKLVITYEVRIIVVDEFNITPPLAAGAVVSDANDGLNGNAAIAAGTAGATVPAGEESAMFSTKTFPFTKGTSLAGTAVATALPADLDASGAPKSGRLDCLRFRKTYCVASA